MIFRLACSRVRPRPTPTLLVSAAVLACLIAILAIERKGWDVAVVPFVLIATVCLIIPQTIALTAVKSSDRWTIATGWIAALAAFLLSLAIAYDVLTSPSSTAGLAFLFWPLFGGVAIAGGLLVVRSIGWLRKFWTSRA